MPPSPALSREQGMALCVMGVSGFLQNMRRKLLFTIVLAMLATGATVITSCTGNDDDPVVRATDTDSEEEDYIGPEDPLDDFMSNFVKTDANGRKMRLGYGKALDEGDPTVLTIGVASLEEAEWLFRRFVTDTLHLASYIEGNMTYSPTDREGRKQGEIYFTAGGEGCIARITFSPDIPQDMVSEVRFIDQQLSPLNRTTPFVAGKEYLLLKAYLDSRHTDYRVFLIEREKATHGDYSDNPTVILCLYDGSGLGMNAEFFRYKYLHSGWDGRFRPLSYQHDWENEGWKETPYGAWTLHENGMGVVEREAHNKSKNMEDEELNLPDIATFRNITRSINELGGVETVFKDDPEALQYWFWAKGHNKKGLTFNLNAWSFKEQREDYWRAYTHLGLWSQFILCPITDDVEYGVRDTDVPQSDEYEITSFYHSTFVFRRTNYNWEFWTSSTKKGIIFDYIY